MTTPPPAHRILIILPCCIGDVVMGTTVLQALRRTYADAHIEWAVGRWSRGVIEAHPDLDGLLDTGNAALPVRQPGDFLRFVRAVRAGNYDLIVSLIASGWMSLAASLMGSPVRAGLDSGGRGFGYTVRVPYSLFNVRHQAEIYLDVVRALGIDTTEIRAHIPVAEADQSRVRARLGETGITGEYLVLNPAGGRNPGMIMDSKRYPPAGLAQLGERIAAREKRAVVVIGGRDDGALVDSVAGHLSTPPARFIGALTFGEIGALAAGASLYIGNDTGLTHLAAAVGAPTVMILGPTDPRRYAPYSDNAIALWKPARVQRGGVGDGTPPSWNWATDGISVEDAAHEIDQFLARINVIPNLNLRGQGSG